MRHGLFVFCQTMSDPDDKPAKPLLKDAGRARAEDREARRAAALRANLMRRKAQSRARRTDEPREAAPDDPKEA